MAYVGSFEGNVYALNAATGAKLWSYATGSTVSSSPAVANGVVYVGSWDNNVYALNAATGAKLWSYTTGNTVFSSPAVVNGVVYIGSQDGSVYALNAATGVKLWSNAISNAVISSPAVANGVVYVGSIEDHSVHALDATTGAGLWSYTTGQVVIASPAVANGVVYTRVRASLPAVARQRLRTISVTPLSRTVSSTALSRTSHGLAIQRRTRPTTPDIRQTLACGDGLTRTGWTRRTDLRICRLGSSPPERAQVKGPFRSWKGLLANAGTNSVHPWVQRRASTEDCMSDLRSWSSRPFGLHRADLGPCSVVWAAYLINCCRDRQHRTRVPQRVRRARGRKYGGQTCDPPR